jgi:hypothetical protein
MQKTLHAKSEADLAAFQVCQVGNTCSFHAISVALRLLINFYVDPNLLSEETNNLWWHGRFMRVAPDWAVTPRMQVRIVRYLSDKYTLSLVASYQHGNLEVLPDLLSDPNSVPLITLLWLKGKAPPIYLGNTDHNYNASEKMGGHTMILAAYHSEHQANGEFMTPWGFINPWLAGTDQLFWMRDEDFQKAWGFFLPFVGPNPLVLITKSNSV